LCSMSIRNAAISSTSLSTDFCPATAASLRAASRSMKKDDNVARDVSEHREGVQRQKHAQHTTFDGFGPVPRSHGRHDHRRPPQRRSEILYISLLASRGASMDIDPVESARDGDQKAEPPDPVAARLSTWVAITVALLATFLGVCK